MNQVVQIVVIDIENWTPFESAGHGRDELNYTLSIAAIGNRKDLLKIKNKGKMNVFMKGIGAERFISSVSLQPLRRPSRWSSPYHPGPGYRRLGPGLSLLPC